MGKKKRKKAIIEPLYKNQDERSLKVQSLSAASAIVKQKEFDRVYFPFVELLMIFGATLQEINPQMVQVPIDGIQTLEEMDALNKAFYETTKRILEIDYELIPFLIDTLSELSKRLAKSRDKQLKNDTDVLIEFLNKEHRIEKLAELPIFRELIVKHFHIFEYFHTELEVSLDQTFEEIMEEGPSDSDVFEAIIDNYDKRYPGFYEKLFMPEEDDFDSLTIDNVDIFNNGLFAIFESEIILNLFSKKEMEQGAKLAENFYKKLSVKDKKLVQNINDKFSKDEEFAEVVVRFLKERITPKRMNRIIQKVEKAAQKQEYQSYEDFFDMFISYLKSEWLEEVIDSTLKNIFAAEARLAFENSTNKATLLYWYI